MATCFGYQYRLQLIHTQHVVKYFVSLPNYSRPLPILDNTEHIADKHANYLFMLDNHPPFHFEIPFVFDGMVTKSETLNALHLLPSMAVNRLEANTFSDRAGNILKGRWIIAIAMSKSRGEFTSHGVQMLPLPEQGGG